MGVRPSTTAAGNSGQVGGGGGERPGRAQSRSTPLRLTLWAAVVSTAVAALLGVTVGAFTAASDGTSSVAQHAAVASDSADLYFSLSDLDAESARLVLLGNGANPATGALDLAGDQIATLAAYNERTTQVDTDLRRLAASGGSADESAISTLTSAVTVYHQIADAAISLDQTAPSAIPDTMGSSAGQPAAAAIGYYARATTLMQSQLLPEAKALRDDKARQLSDAASSAHLAGIIGAVAAGLVGLLALGLAFRMHRQLRLWFRRATNVGVLVTALISLTLALGSVVALAATASDASNAGARFADYLAVTRTRAASYDVDGAVTRYLLMPDTTQAPIQGAQKSAANELHNLSQSGATANKRWDSIVGSNGDIAKITGQITTNPVDGSYFNSVSDIATALIKDTGTARGDEAFDFYYYDSALMTLSNDRLAAFDDSMSSAHSDLAGWSWLPWALAVGALTGLGLGVRPRLAEYR